MFHRSFYQGDVKSQVEKLTAGAGVVEEPVEIVAGVVPHAGWVYSGRVAGRVWKNLAKRARPDTVIIFGAVHHAGVERNAIYPDGSWETPLGEVEIDADLAREILQEIGGLVEADPEAHAGEHAIEVQVPFVKALLPSARIVPIAVPPGCHPAQLGDLLGHLVRDRAVVAVGSTDLTHYGDAYAFAPRGIGPSAHDWMKSNDRRVLGLVEGLLAEEIPSEVTSHRNACGPGALAAATALARARGAERGIVLEHTTSHEVRPEADFTFGVGYAGMVF